MSEVIECRSPQVIDEDDLISTHEFLTKALSDGWRDIIYVGRSEQHRDGTCGVWRNTLTGTKRQKAIENLAKCEQAILEGKTIDGVVLWKMRWSAV